MRSYIYTIFAFHIKSMAHIVGAVCFILTILPHAALRWKVSVSPESPTPTSPCTSWTAAGVCCEGWVGLSLSLYCLLCLLPKCFYHQHLTQCRRLSTNSLPHPVNTTHWPCTAMMLDQCRRWWHSIITVLCQRLMFASTISRINVVEKLVFNTLPCVLLLLSLYVA